VEDTHHNIAFLDAPNSALNFLVEDMGKIGECCDEVTNCVIIAELSILIVLLHIKLSGDPRWLELAFQD